MVFVIVVSILFLAWAFCSGIMIGLWLVFTTLTHLNWDPVIILPLISLTSLFLANMSIWFWSIKRRSGQVWAQYIRDYRPFAQLSIYIAISLWFLGCLAVSGFFILTRVINGSPLLISSVEALTTTIIWLIGTGMSSFLSQKVQPMLLPPRK